MSISSLNGALGFATQFYSGSPASWRYTTGYAGTLEPAVQWHAATDIDFGAVQDERAAPQEVNSEMVPLGGYKGMAYVAGGATINPRLESSAGVLLLNLLGYSTSGSAVNEESLMAPTSLAAGSGSAAGTLVAAGLGNAKTLVATILTSGSISAIGNTEAITFNGGTSGSAAISLSSLKTSGATFKHIAAGGVAAAAITSITLPQVTSTGNTRVSLGWYAASAKEHTFSFDPSNKACIGWMTVRKLMPKPNCGVTGATFGEEGVDCRLANFRLNVPANGVVSARVDWQGRQPQFYDNPSWTPSYETFNSVPISCVLEGGIVIPAFSTNEMPITNLSITMSNNTTQPQQEMVIGSYYPDDFVPMSRAMTITATYKWADAAMYRAILTGQMTSPGDNTKYFWSPTPWYSPFWARVAAPNTTVDGITKYSLTAFAPNVMWSVAAPPALAGGDLVMLQLQGTVMKPLLATQNYCELRLVNDTTAYTYA